MNDPIKLQPAAIGSAIVQTVDARDLHTFLGIGKDFSSWVKNQIARARLVENRDYTCSPSRVSSPSGTKHTIEYHLTIDAAKQIAMMSETDKGFEIRDYFIECERRALAQPAPQSPAELSRMQLIQLAMQAEQERLESEQARAALEVQVNHLTPKADALDRLETADGSLCIRDAAKTLQVQEKVLKKYLIEHKWVYRRPMGHEILAYSDRIQQGLIEHKITRGEKADGSEWVSTQARITAKGMGRLAEMLSRPEPGSLLAGRAA